jgi:REP element-mobilizing transposase RayT
VVPTRIEFDVQRGRSSVYTLHAHLVFLTKYRRPVFNDDMLSSCERLMADICAGFGAELREFNGETDHVICSRTTRRACRSRRWSTDSKALRLAGYASNTRHTFGNTCGATTSGPRPT